MMPQPQKKPSLYPTKAWSVMALLLITIIASIVISSQLSNNFSPLNRDPSLSTPAMGQQWGWPFAYKGYYDTDSKTYATWNMAMVALDILLIFAAIHFVIFVADRLMRRAGTSGISHN